MIIKNILITRFSWHHPKTAGDADTIFNDWLDLRINLFEKYLLKSFLNQIIRPDYWLILISRPHLPAYSRLFDLTKSISQVKYLIYESQPLVETLNKFFHENLPREPVHVLTTRIDSDDIISNDFFLELLKFTYNNPVEKGLYTFKNGLIFNASNNNFYTNQDFSNYINNPFISFMENYSKPNSLSTVYATMHTRMHENASIIFEMDSSTPKWASVVHGSNLENKVPVNSTATFEVANFFY